MTTWGNEFHENVDVIEAFMNVSLDISVQF